MTAELHTILEAAGVRLEPLIEDHRERLRAACAEDREIWQIYSYSFDREHFDAGFDMLLASKRVQSFAILDGERVSGMTSYISADPERGVVEIGFTYIAPSLRGTGFNARLKTLMLDQAFACGYRRVEFRVDARNARSQAAVEKIGGVREGVLRQDRITWTGHVRDTVLFSILADEWRSERV